MVKLFIKSDVEGNHFNMLTEVRHQGLFRYDEKYNLLNDDVENGITLRTSLVASVRRKRIADHITSVFESPLPPNSTSAVIVRRVSAPFARYFRRTCAAA